MERIATRRRASSGKRRARLEAPQATEEKTTAANAPFCRAVEKAAARSARRRSFARRRRTRTLNLSCCCDRLGEYCIARGSHCTHIRNGRCEFGSDFGFLLRDDRSLTSVPANFHGRRDQGAPGSEPHCCPFAYSGTWCRWGFLAAQDLFAGPGRPGEGPKGRCGHSADGEGGKNRWARRVDRRAS